MKRKRQERMWQPTPPPEAPQDAEKLLLELAHYYQELVEYHQQAAREAYLRLSQVSALIGEPKIMSVESVNLNESTTTESPRLKGSEKVVSTMAKPSFPNKSLLSSLFEKEKQPEIAEKSLDTIRENLIDSILTLLKSNKGKILHTSYIDRELSEAETTLDRDLREILIQGEKDKLWASVPDSPGCWTLDLKEIPDLAVKSKSQKKKKINRKKPLLQKGKMKQYSSLTEAVSDCLQQSYPEVCSSSTVSQWLYPKELSLAESKNVREAINKVLSRGEGDLWKRVSLGKYIWKEKM